MITTFVPTWSVSVLLVLLAALVIWCAVNAADSQWDVVSGNHDEPRLCGDQVEIETEDGPLILTCAKYEHPEDEDHMVETPGGEWIDRWEWSW